MLQRDFIVDFANRANANRRKWRLGPTIWYLYTDAIAGDEQGWAAHAGVYKSNDSSPEQPRPAWGAIGTIAQSKMWEQLPPVHICRQD